MTTPRPLPPLLAKFLSFSGVGAFATALQYLILGFLVEVLSWPAVASSAVGFSLSALANYYLNYHLTFRSTNPHRVALLRFAVVALVGLVLNTSLMAVLVEALNVHYLVSQVAATLTVLVWNFFANLLWSFRAAAAE